MKQTQKNWEKEIYGIIDSFLTEAKDQNGNDRSLERLNQDRHLAAERFMEILAQQRNEIEEEINMEIDNLLDRELGRPDAKITIGEIKQVIKKVGDKI